MVPLVIFFNFGHTMTCGILAPGPGIYATSTLDHRKVPSWSLLHQKYWHKDSQTQMANLLSSLPISRLNKRQIPTRTRQISYCLGGKGSRAKKSWFGQGPHPQLKNM